MIKKWTTSPYAPSVKNSLVNVLARGSKFDFQL